MNNVSITTLVAELRSGQGSSLDLVNSCLDAIEKQDDVLNAFITVFADDARRQARNADAAISDGHDDVGPLHGIPVSVKDMIDVRGTRTTAASHVRADHRASTDAELVTRLRRAGAIVIGKCNLHEFAFGTTGYESAFGLLEILIANNGFQVVQAVGRQFPLQQTWPSHRLARIQVDRSASLHPHAV